MYFKFEDKGRTVFDVGSIYGVGKVAPEDDLTGKDRVGLNIMVNPVTGASSGVAVGWFIHYLDEAVRDADYERLCRALSGKSTAGSEDEHCGDAMVRYIWELLGSPVGVSAADAVKGLVEERDRLKAELEKASQDVKDLREVGAYLGCSASGEVIDRIDELAESQEKGRSEYRTLVAALDPPTLAPPVEWAEGFRKVYSQAIQVLEGEEGWDPKDVADQIKDLGSRLKTREKFLQQYNETEELVAEALGCPEDTDLVNWAKSCKNSMDKAGEWEPEMVEALGILGLEWEKPEDLVPGAKKVRAVLDSRSIETNHLRKALAVFGMPAEIHSGEAVVQAKELAPNLERASAFYKAAKQHLGPELLPEVADRVEPGTSKFE